MASPEIVEGVLMTPQGPVQLSEDEARAILEEQEEQERIQLARNKSIMEGIQSKIDLCVTAKADIEKRWVDDLRQYEGFGRVVGTSKDGKTQNDMEGPPRIHRTRSRTDMMEARLSDMLLKHPSIRMKLPKDWKPSGQQPVQQAIDPQTGQPVPQSPADIEAAERAVAEKACAGMNDRIQTILNESKFPTHGRRVIRDGCRIGTGLFMGPNATIRYKRKFSTADGVVALDIQESTEPEVKSGDPWCFYPEMVESADKAQYAAYLHLMGATELQEFAKHPGIDQKAVARILKTEPDLGAVGRNLAYRNAHSPLREETANRYPVWRYTGIMDRDDAENLGVKLDDGGEDVLVPMPMVDIWFCQNEVLRARIRPMKGDFRIPYYPFSPFPADDTMFGYSLPFLARDSQRAADSAYQIALHNASVSSGPVVFARREAFEPKRGDNMEINGPKWLWVTDPETPLQDLIHVVQFPNSVAEAISIMDRILQIMDDELNMPQIIGDTTATKPLTQTASGMAMLMNDMVTVIQRRGAAAWDDDVMLPIGERLYWWEMLYGQDDSIKDDFVVEALGQSELLVKDMRIQHLMMLQQMYPGDPDFKDRFFKEEIVKKLDIPVDQAMRPKEEADALRQQATADPETEAKRMMAEATMKRADLEAANAERDDAFRKEERMLSHRERLAELEHKREQDRKDLLIEQIRTQREFAKLAQARDLKLTEISAMLGLEKTNQQAEQFFRAADMRLQAEEVADRKQNRADQIRHESPVRIAG